MKRFIKIVGLASLLCGSLASGNAFGATLPITATTANAPGILVDGADVSVVVPYSSDNSLRAGAVEAVLESPVTRPKNQSLKTGNVNSCAASPATGITVCSGVFGSSYFVRPPSNKVGGFKSGVTQRIHFTGGDCANCGVAIDDAMGIAIISTAKGYLPVGLAPFQLQPTISTNGEAISGQFGYDPMNHRILSPNYQILDLKHFKSGTPHFQIIDIASSQRAFDLADNNEFFNSNGTCNRRNGGTSQRDSLPDSGAYDVATGIAYVSFRSPSDCVLNNTVEDVGIFDLNQITFDIIANTWQAPKQIQTLSEMDKLGNGITGFAIAPGKSLAIVSDRRETAFGATGFGVLKLPTTSGSGIPSIQDWVQADMPNDPSGKPWRMSFMPNGVSAYTSPATGNAMGVVINFPRTYAAVVDLAALLNASRQAGTSHTLSSMVDLVAQNIVRFVNLRPGK